MRPSDDEQVVIRRFADAVAAEIALNFLRDHGVAAVLHGSGAVAATHQLTALPDYRLVVARGQAQRALDTLDAMDSPEAPSDAGEPLEHTGETLDAAAGPYRVSRVPASEGVREAKRHRSGPIVLAFVVPGGGHFYARHQRVGMMFCTAILAFVVAGTLSNLSWLVFAAVLVAAFDAVLGVAAVARYNRGQTLGNGAQTALAAAAMAASVGAAFGLGASGRLDPPPARNPRPVPAAPIDMRPW